MPTTKKKLDSTTKKYAAKSSKNKPSMLGSGTAKKAESALKKRRKMLDNI